MATRPSGAARQTLPDSRPTPGKRGREPDSPDTRSPTSPRSAGPLTRKRAASLRTDPRIEDLSLNTPTTSTAPSNTSQQQQQQQQQQHPHHPVEKVKERELICLCTPAPKVPRPRNGMSHSLTYFLSARLSVCLTCPIFLLIKVFVCLILFLFPTSLFLPILHCILPLSTTNKRAASPDLSLPCKRRRNPVDPSSPSRLQILCYLSFPLS
jgi:hypothetical protein